MDMYGVETNRYNASLLVLIIVRVITYYYIGRLNEKKNCIYKLRVIS